MWEAMMMKMLMMIMLILKTLTMIAIFWLWDNDYDVAGDNDFEWCVRIIKVSHNDYDVYIGTRTTAG